jgi:glycosyltransferase involved in cell wall biosynthesis
MTAAIVRPPGLSAFVRCKNEEEYIAASLLSAYRVFDEIVLVLNNSTDRTRDIVQDLMTDHPKIRLLDYPHECSAIGPGYHERVLRDPMSSLARYYNWCLEQTRFSHVCKWDGDMVATPEFESVRKLIEQADVILFDGWDVLGEHTTDLEPRIFRCDPARARYVDWDMYEVLQHDYSRQARLGAKCYLHMKLVKREWLHRTWTSPNLLATRSVPETGATAAPSGLLPRLRSWARKARGALHARTRVNKGMQP